MIRIAPADTRMRILFRIIAVVIALAVVVTALAIVQLAVIGSIVAVARSGALGALTIAGWLATLTLGPVAAVQLWRLRRTGLTLTTMLCAIAIAYLLIGLVFLPGFDFFDCSNALLVLLHALRESTFEFCLKVVLKETLMLVDIATNFC